MNKIAKLSIVLAGVLWGSMGLFVRKLDTLGLDSMEIVSIRSMVTCSLLFGVLICFGRKWLKIKKRDLWCFVGTGIFSVLFFCFCYFKAITMTDLSVAAILLYTAPMWVMIFSRILFGERLNKRKLLSLGITFVGCVLVTGVLGRQTSISFWGILAGLGAGLGYALYSIFSRYALEKGYHVMTITFYTFLFTSIGTGFLVDLNHIRRVVFESPSHMMLCVALGIVCTVVPYLLYTLGLQFVENSKASILASVEPVAATLFGVFVFGETLGVSTGLGIVMVLIALVLVA